MESRYVTDCDCYLPEIEPLEGARPFLRRPIFSACRGRWPNGRTGTILWRCPPLQPHLTDSYAYQGVVLAVFMVFCYLIHSYRSSIGIVFKILTGRVSSDKVYDEYPLFFRKFLSWTALWGMLLIGGLLIRYGGLYGIEGWLPRQIPFATDMACLAVLFAAAAVAVYRKIVTRIIGGVIRNDLFFEKLRFTIRIFSSFIYILLTPLFLVVALTEGPGIDRLLHGTAVFAAALYLLYLAKSYRFFVARDVSILQWILYLCAVELISDKLFRACCSQKLLSVFPRRRSSSVSRRSYQKKLTINKLLF